MFCGAGDRQTDRQQGGGGGGRHVHSRRGFLACLSCVPSIQGKGGRSDSQRETGRRKKGTKITKGKQSKATGKSNPTRAATRKRTRVCVCFYSILFLFDSMGADQGSFVFVVLSFNPGPFVVFVGCGSLLLLHAGAAPFLPPFSLLSRACSLFRCPVLVGVL